ncbi:MAG TPA: response regulator [Nitrospirae bacterium]|nr:chemotaxis protein CheY [bacterium BMS3Abin06]HDH11208.1 response regulator [Nitrospirota bacterium]HDZ02449.1 response regulator [Nitrospirota bacterium]
MGKTILIVDDSASMRQLVTFALKDAGYDVIAAVDGKDAIVKLSGTKADMVVTDLNMPNMDGIELIKQIRSTAAFKFIPVVMLTTESQESRKQEGKQAGASGWLVKPFTPEKLIDVIKKFVR